MTKIDPYNNLPLLSMTRKIGETIRSIVGRVVEVNLQDDSRGWENFLGVRIECELKKVIAQGRIVNLEGRKLWIPFTY